MRATRRRARGVEKDAVKARTYDGLLYRHWTAWGTGQSEATPSSCRLVAAPRRIWTEGASYDVPPRAA